MESATSINSCLIEQVAWTLYLLEQAGRLAQNNPAFDVAREKSKIGRGVEQKVEHLPRPTVSTLHALLLEGLDRCPITSHEAASLRS